MKSLTRSLANRVHAIASLPALAIVFVSIWSASAQAAVVLRVEGHPASSPVKAYVKVTDSLGAPVPQLDVTDLTLEIDGTAITIAGDDLTIPPSLDPNQRVSVVFAMDYSQSVVNAFEAEMQNAVLTFIGEMADGDYAAVVKFNATNPDGASVVVEFTEINQGAGNPELVAGVMAEYPGNGTNMADALIVALNHLQTPPAALPEGPKAIILIGDGSNSDGTVEVEEVIAQANASNIPIFTVGIGDFAGPGRTDALTDLGVQTGGAFFPAPTVDDIQDAYVTVADLLDNEYLITFEDGITDCAPHVLEVTVNGETATATYTRRTCDTDPDPFTFTSQTGLAPAVGATSDAATVSGIEVPAHISVIGGTYSIGCTDPYTDVPATVESGDTVCVRHQTPSTFSTEKVTTLTVGGFAATFTTTTRADSGGGGGGGGGGAAGLFELLLLCLGLLLVGQRRTA